MNVNFDDIGDILEYGNISDNDAIEICNMILKASMDEKDEIVLEAMFHAVYMGVSHRHIAKQINIDIIVEKLEYFSEQILDYIIIIMAYSGKTKYIEMIKKIGEKYCDLDVNEAINILKYNI